MLEDLITRSRVKGLTESTITQPVNKLDTWIRLNTGEVLIAMKKSLENEHSPAFVRRPLKKVAREVLIEVWSDDEVNKVSEAAVAQMTTNATMVQAIARNLVSKKAVMAPSAKFVTNRTQKDVDKAAQSFLVVAPQSLPHFSGGLVLAGND